MVNQQQGNNDEIVKCVLVGDSGVGKTRLICACACNAKYDLKSLVKSHAATVWATDHYRHDKEVLDRSWCEVDGVRVSLRLWDTFGYHDKDRGFAYRGADVVAICFSTVKPSSLLNVKRIWYPEIRRFCPTTPIILVGTQVDLRYLHKDDNYISMQKGLLYKHIVEKDVITPETGRAMAKDIGAPYYETSVLTHHGVEDVFINCIRACLIENRKIKFWNAQLRKVQRPLIQPPMMIPRPALPDITVPPATLHNDLSLLLYNQAEGDVLFVVHASCIRAHKICLMATSEFFEELFSLEPLSVSHWQDKLKQPLRMRAQSDPRHHDEELLLQSDQESLSAMDGDSSQTASAVYVHDIHITEQYDHFPIIVPFSHPAVQLVEIKYIDDPFDPSQQQLQTVVTMSDVMTPSAFQHVLDFLYTGTVKERYDIWNEVKTVASLLNLTNMLVIMSNMTSSECFLNNSLEREFQDMRCKKLKTLALEKELLTDVIFKVDDGLVSAHKPLLMVRCEMMFAMFSSDFVESSAAVVPFPGINCDTFKALREYLYTSEQSDMTGVDCIQLIEVANRLCLPRLVSLTELFIVKELLKAEKEGEDILEEILLILQPAELHNATQLAKWCRRYLALHYKEIHQKHGKLLRSLHKEDQDFIENNRWPPIWYLKDLDHFERVSQDSSRCEQRQVQDFNRWLRCSTGCLCFSRRGRARFNRDESIEMPI